MDLDEEAPGEVPANPEAIAEALPSREPYSAGALNHEPHGRGDSEPLSNQSKPNKLAGIMKRKAHGDTEVLLSREVIRQANLVAKLTRRLAAFGR